MDTKQPKPRVYAGSQASKLIKSGEEFFLENKFYVNVDQTIIFKSNANTGKIFIPKNSQ